MRPDQTRRRHSPTDRWVSDRAEADVNRSGQAETGQGTKRSSPTSSMTSLPRAMSQTRVRDIAQLAMLRIASATRDSSGSPGDRRDLTGRRTPPSIPRQPLHPSVEVVGSANPPHDSSPRQASTARETRHPLDAPQNRRPRQARPVDDLLNPEDFGFIYRFIASHVSLLDRSAGPMHPGAECPSSPAFKCFTCFGSLHENRSLRFLVTSITACAALYKPSRRGQIFFRRRIFPRTSCIRPNGPAIAPNRPVLHGPKRLTRLRHPDATVPRRRRFDESASGTSGTFDSHPAYRLARVLSGRPQARAPASRTRGPASYDRWTRRTVQHRDAQPSGCLDARRRRDRL